MAYISLDILLCHSYISDRDRENICDVAPVPEEVLMATLGYTYVIDGC